MTPLMKQVARAICQERCAYMGEPACWTIRDDLGQMMPWPAPACDDPGCEAIAMAAIDAVAASLVWYAAHRKMPGGGCQSPTPVPRRSVPPARPLSD